MTDGNKVTNDAGIIISYMQAAVVLNITVTANFDTIDVAADGNIEPGTAVFFHFYFTDNIGTFKSMLLFCRFWAFALQILLTYNSLTFM